MKISYNTSYIKMSIRKAPPEKASEHEEGFIAKGHENVAYVVKKNKNGEKMWIRVLNKQSRREAQERARGLRH